MDINLINHLKTQKNIDIYTHSGSYELVQKGVACLAKVNLEKIDVSDLLMLFEFGNLGHGKEARDGKIKESSLLEEDKKYMLDLNARINTGDYTNHESKNNGNCGLFSRGYRQLHNNSDKYTAQEFIKMLIEVSKIDDSENILKITEECLSKNLKGMQAGVASQILHLLNPMVFPILNDPGRDGYIKKLGLRLEKANTISQYIHNVKIIRDFRDNEFPGINYRTIDVAFWNSKDGSSSYWFVGAYWDKIDMTETFINNGYWENGYDDKYIDKVNSIKIGDNIAIKSVYVKKGNVPFDTRGNDVSCMAIKALGTVVKNHNNGKRIDVEWQAVNPRKEWYFYTHFRAIWEIKPADGWMQRALIEFTFNNINQDINRFINDPFLAERFGDDIDNGSEYADTDGIEYPSYSKDEFLTEVYFEEEKYEDIVALLNRKKNIILQGAPGVGKSYMAKRLAYSIIGAKDESKIETIQFHQSYSYEDFIEGFRPSGNGNLVLEKGAFYNFCVEKARKDEAKYIACINSEHEEKQKEANKYKYFFIIDEINRGNLSKIMGELMSLLENDKRGGEFAMKLTYSKIPFYVPDNVYVIGMMNTADRSLAIIDYALRRRFSFVSVEPIFDNPQFVAYFKNKYREAETIIEKIKKLNNFISENLDSGHQIGHSYFFSKHPFTSKGINGIIKYEIEELLNEYFFDDRDNLEKAKDLLK